MSESPKRRKRSKLQQQATPVSEETGQKQVSEEERLENLMTILNDLKKKGELVDIQICPRCKSPNIRRVVDMGGDMSGQAAWTPPKYECLDCGWRGRLTLYATNRPVDSKSMDVVTDYLKGAKRSPNSSV